MRMENILRMGIFGWGFWRGDIKEREKVRGVYCLLARDRCVIWAVYVGSFDQRIVPDWI